jgi:hypothetical protein
VKFPAERFGGAAHKQSVERNEFGDPVQRQLDKQVLDPQNLAHPYDTKFSLQRGGSRQHVNWMRSFDWDKSLPLPVVPLAKAVPQSFENAQIQAKDKRTVEVVTGTSFSNVTYWQERRMQWDAEQSAQPAKKRK